MGTDILPVHAPNPIHVVRCAALRISHEVFAHDERARPLLQQSGIPLPLLSELYPAYGYAASGFVRSNTVVTYRHSPAGDHLFTGLDAEGNEGWHCIGLLPRSGRYTRPTLEVQNDIDRLMSADGAPSIFEVHDRFYLRSLFSGRLALVRDARLRKPGHRCQRGRSLLPPSHMELRGASPL
jgi:hypothetical protein